MMRIILAVLSIFFVGCHGKEIENERIITSKSNYKTTKQTSQTKIDSLYKWSRNDMDIQEIKISGDTLKFVSAGWVFYYPFGKYSTMAPIRSQYPFFKYEMQADTAMVDPAELYRMTFKDSFVKFIKNSDTEHMEIVYGKISNNEIVFSNGFRVGLNKDLFFKYFFRNQIHLGNIKNIKINSVLYGVFHYYHFENDKISSITIDTDYQVYKF